MQEYLTPDEIAERFRIHPRTVRRLCKRGDLRGAVKVGRQWRIPADAVRAALGEVSDHAERDEVSS